MHGNGARKKMESTMFVEIEFFMFVGLVNEEILEHLTVLMGIYGNS